MIQLVSDRARTGMPVWQLGWQTGMDSRESFWRPHVYFICFTDAGKPMDTVSIYSMPWCTLAHTPISPSCTFGQVSLSLPRSFHSPKALVCNNRTSLCIIFLQTVADLWSLKALLPALSGRLLILCASTLRKSEPLSPWFSDVVPLHHGALAFLPSHPWCADSGKPDWALGAPRMEAS